MNRLAEAVTTLGVDLSSIGQDMFWVSSLAVVLAVGLGFGMARARLCLLAATSKRVFEGDASGLRLQALTVALMSALLVIELVLRVPGVRLPVTAGLTYGVLIGAVLLSVGFIINKGCYLGSVDYIGRGKSKYLFTLLGIFLSELFSVPRLLAFRRSETLTATMSIPLISCLAAALALTAWLTLRSVGAHDIGRRTQGVLVAALCATVLFALLPGWNYGVAISGLARPALVPSGVQQIAGAAVFIGAIIACRLAGQWRLELPTFAGGARCLLGGFVMQTGAQCVPGGSDSWLFWTIPGGGVHGIVAYAVSMQILLGWWWIQRETRRHGAFAELSHRIKAFVKGARPDGKTGQQQS